MDEQHSWSAFPALLLPPPPGVRPINNNNNYGGSVERSAGRGRHKLISCVQREKNARATPFIVCSLAAATNTNTSVKTNDFGGGTLRAVVVVVVVDGTPKVDASSGSERNAPRAGVPTTHALRTMTGYVTRAQGVPGDGGREWKPF